MILEDDAWGERGWSWDRGCLLGQGAPSQAGRGSPESSARRREGKSLNLGRAIMSWPSSLQGDPHSWLLGLLEALVQGPCCLRACVSFCFSCKSALGMYREGCGRECGKRSLNPRNAEKRRLDSEGGYSLSEM